MKYLKLFETENDRSAYENSESYIEPYVSCLNGGGVVHYNKPFVETRLIATFNVTNTSNPTKILSQTTAFTSVEIDGVEMSPIGSEYTFDVVGLHEVKYTLADETTVGRYAFQQCTDLISVSIPNGVTNINYQAFQGCHNLTTITLPDTITTIGEDVFNYCSSISSITIPDSVTSIGNYAFSRCGGLTSVIIGSGLTTINDNTFMYCDSLTSVVIPNSVTSIGSYAFYGCSGLTSITIPNSVTSIDNAAFSGCSGLTSITIPNSVTSIGVSAFYECSSLTSINIPNSVINIGRSAFRYCTSLQSITCLAITAPTIQSSTFRDIKTNGTLTVTQGSTGYDVWMGTGDYYLGKYGWTKVEQ